MLLDDLSADRIDILEDLRIAIFPIVGENGICPQELVESDFPIAQRKRKAVVIGIPIER